MQDAWRVDSTKKTRVNVDSKDFLMIICIFRLLTRGRMITDRTGSERVGDVRCVEWMIDLFVVKSWTQE